MGFGPEELCDKALVALEEAVQECRYRTPRRSFALRFALAYLWAYSAGDRAPFEHFWKVLADPKSPWSFSAADGALVAIYRHLGRTRDEELVHDLWRRREIEERRPR